MHHQPAAFPDLSSATLCPEGARDAAGTDFQDREPGCAASKGGICIVFWRAQFLGMSSVEVADCQKHGNG